MFIPPSSPKQNSPLQPAILLRPVKCILPASSHDFFENLPLNSMNTPAPHFGMQRNPFHHQYAFNSPRHPVFTQGSAKPFRSSSRLVTSQDLQERIVQEKRRAEAKLREAASTRSPMTKLKLKTSALSHLEEEELNRIELLKIKDGRVEQEASQVSSLTRTIGRERQQIALKARNLSRFKNETSRPALIYDPTRRRNVWVEEYPSRNHLDYMLDRKESLEYLTDHTKKLEREARQRKSNLHALDEEVEGCLDQVERVRQKIGQVRSLIQENFTSGERPLNPSRPASPPRSVNPVRTNSEIGTLVDEFDSASVNPEIRRERRWQKRESATQREARENYKTHKPDRPRKESSHHGHQWWQRSRRHNN